MRPLASILFSVSRARAWLSPTLRHEDHVPQKAMETQSISTPLRSEWTRWLCRVFAGRGYLAFWNQDGVSTAEFVPVVLSNESRQKRVKAVSYMIKGLPT
jgi:hypothetical protein